MTSYKVYLSENAEADLREIIRYVALQFRTPLTAQKMLEAFEKAIGSLSEMPQRCPLVSDRYLADMQYRKLIVRNHIVFFIIDEESTTVNVERILHSRRDWSRIL